MSRPAAQVLAWIFAACAFGAALHVRLGAQAAQEYFTTYLIEWTMSFDNLVVLSAAVLAAPPPSRSTVLRLGILGAIVTRLIMIVGGVALIGHYHWPFYLFGTFLILLALKMASPRWDVLSVAARPLGRLASGRLSRFQNPLVLGVLTVISYDVIFALDSVPAALAVSKNWVVIFSANAFSVMGLGALYGVIAILEKKFHALPQGVAAVLLFVGLKMILEPLLNASLDSFLSLAIVLGLIAASIAYSLLCPARAP